ncbi:unnamed protein product [Cochlearia groenlandica]
MSRSRRLCLDKILSSRSHRLDQISPTLSPSPRLRSRRLDFAVIPISSSRSRSLLHCLDLSLIAEKMNLRVQDHRVPFEQHKGHVKAS